MIKYYTDNFKLTWKEFFVGLSQNVLFLVIIFFVVQSICFLYCYFYAEKTNFFELLKKKTEKHVGTAKSGFKTISRWWHLEKNNLFFVWKDTFTELFRFNLMVSFFFLEIWMTIYWCINQSLSQNEVAQLFAISLLGLLASDFYGKTRNYILFQDEIKDEKTTKTDRFFFKCYEVTVWVSFGLFFVLVLRMTADYLGYN